MKQQPWLDNGRLMLGGLRLIASKYVGDQYEDWSQVRSHGRAARRRKLGHPQRIVIRYKPNGKYLHDVVNHCIIAHPDDIHRLELAVAVDPASTD